MDHPDLDQQIQSTDKHQEDPWMGGPPKAIHVQRDCCETGGWIIQTTLEKAEEVVTVKQSERILCFANKQTRVAKLCLEFETCCKGGEKCKQAEGWLNNCN